MADTFPPFIYRAEYDESNAGAAFVRQVNGTLDTAENRFREFSTEAQRLVDQAMSSKRNSFGSLDLGADQMREAARAQQALATAAREVATAQATAAREVGDTTQATRLAIAATEAFAREQEEAARAVTSNLAVIEQTQAVLNRNASATDLVTASNRRGTSAQQSVINSTRASRVAFVQLGQQMQDMVVQAQMGTNAFMIFSQQVPQAAFALSGLSDSANKTQARIGKVATFLSGPWGAAVFAATAVLGPFVYNLTQSGEAADESARSQRKLAEVLDDTTSSYQEVTKALDDYNRAKEREREVTILTLAEQAKSISANLKEAISIREKTRALLESYDAQINNPTIAPDAGEAAGLALVRNQVAGRVATQTAEIEKLQKAARNATIEVADLVAEMQSNPEKNIKTGFEVLREQARKTITDVEELTERLADLNRQEKAALESVRKSGNARGAAAEASLGDMVELVKRLFPGATITSTTGGRHTKGSDHYSGRAIDFVPGGGMGQYTTAEVEQILRDAGVDLRRNRSGTQQLFGPGRSASKPGDHDDHFHFAWQGGAPDPDKVQEALAKSQKLLEDFGARSSESIARINERFDEQPRLIDQAARATRELDKIIADLSEKKPAGFEQMIADAEAAKQTIEEALVRPIEDMRRESERQLQIQKLILAGRDEEAIALQTIWQLEDQMGDLTAARRAEIEGIVVAREREMEAVRRLQDQQDAYLDATRSVRAEIEAIFSGRGNIGNFKQIFKDLNAKVLTEKLFGDMLDGLDDSVKAQFGRAVDHLEVQTDRTVHSFGKIEGAAYELVERLQNPTAAAATSSISKLPGTTGTGLSKNEIVVIGSSDRPTVANMTPDAYAQLVSKGMTKPIVDVLSDLLGPKLAAQLGGVISGVFYGNMTAGTTGSVLGGLKGAFDSFGSDVFGDKLAGTISKGLGSALGGAQTGTIVSGLAGAFGINLSGTGAQLGGAVGSFLPIPGGSLIGAIAGGIIGKIFGGSKPYGTARLTGADAISVSGKGDGRSQGASTLGGAVQEALANIAGQLDAEVGSYLVSIGTYKDNYRVSTRGSSGKLGGYSGTAAQNEARYGLYDFGDDQGAAIAFAVMDAIKDGAIKGLRTSTQRLLSLSSDAEQAVADALQFESVFTRLKALKDPVGAELDDLDSEFKKLKDLFSKASASTEEWNQLEELYWLERDQIVKDAMASSLGGLSSFLDELTTGNSALSLRDRKATAMASYAPLADRVAAGDATAYDDFVDAARTLLDIERQLSGSQSGYFDLLSEVTGLTQKALDGGTNYSDRDSPFGTRSGYNEGAGIVAGLDSLRDEIAAGTNAQLAAVNQNLGTMIGLLGRSSYYQSIFANGNGTW